MPKRSATKCLLLTSSKEPNKRFCCTTWTKYNGSTQCRNPRILRLLASRAKCESYKGPRGFLHCVDPLDEASNVFRVWPRITAELGLPTLNSSTVYSIAHCRSDSSLICTCKGHYFSLPRLARVIIRTCTNEHRIATSMHLGSIDELGFYKKWKPSVLHQIAVIGLAIL